MASFSDSNAGQRGNDEHGAIKGLCDSLSRVLRKAAVPMGGGDRERGRGDAMRDESERSARLTLEVTPELFVPAAQAT